MKKNSPVYLMFQILFLGVIVKVISLVSKMLMTRSFKIEAISIFSLCNPLLLLILTISSFSLQTTISSLISKNEDKKKQIIITSLCLIFIITIVLSSLIFIFRNALCNALHNLKAMNVILSLIPLIPLHAISAVIKGYYIGKGKILIASLSQVFEESGRLLFFIIISFFASNFENEILASFCVTSLCFGEIFQTSSMILLGEEKYYKRIKSITSSFFNKNNYDFKKIISFSLPLTLSRLLGSFTYFLEPIIFSSILFLKGKGSEEITIQYGLLTQYALPLIMLPTFFSLTLSTYMLPRLSSLAKDNNKKEIKLLLFKILFFVGGGGLISSLLFFLFPSFFLSLLYGSSLGTNIVSFLSLPLIALYFEQPLVHTLYALNESKKTFYSTLISSLVRIISLFILSYKYEIIGVCISLILGVYTNIILNSFFVIKKLFSN